ncbi:MAG: DeoR/GlpR transcriptional regulator [Gammaproteobacteria bacterium]|nr:DeoR/GlpR transcriptional regulator [Gammaproteobacteria bacterium]
MRPRDRQFRIIDIVRTRGRVSVEELSRTFATSAETIRRDLTFLASTGKIQKVHGGAVPVRDFGEGPFAQRMQLNGPAKRTIAQLARRLVAPGDTLFIDTGSTTLVIAEELAGIDDLTVITNSTAIARAITSANETVRMYLLGGSYNEDNRQTCGRMALDQLNSFHGNLAIITVVAIAAGSGAMDYSCDEAEIASAMIARSDKVILLADSSKFDRVAPFVVASFDQIDTLVCEKPPQGALAHCLHEANVEIVC